MAIRYCRFVVRVHMVTKFRYGYFRDRILALSTSSRICAKPQHSPCNRQRRNVADDIRKISPILGAAKVAEVQHHALHHCITASLHHCITASLHHCNYSSLYTSSPCFSATVKNVPGYRDALRLAHIHCRTFDM